MIICDLEEMDHIRESLGHITTLQFTLFQKFFYRIKSIYLDILFKCFLKKSLPPTIQFPLLPSIHSASPMSTAAIIIQNGPERSEKIS